MKILIDLDTPVTCPQSNHTFPLNKGITEQVLGDLIAKTEATQNADLARLKTQIQKEAQQAHALQLESLHRDLEAERDLAKKRFSHQRVTVRELRDEKAALEQQAAVAIANAQAQAEKAAKEALEKEERAIQKHWKKRHQTIQGLTRSVSQMLGDLCAAGNGTLKELEQVAGLELLDGSDTDQADGTDDVDISDAA